MPAEYEVPDWITANGDRYTATCPITGETVGFRCSDPANLPLAVGQLESWLATRGCWVQNGRLEEIPERCIPPGARDVIRRNIEAAHARQRARGVYPVARPV